jgi:hypothetical protein
MHLQAPELMQRETESNFTCWSKGKGWAVLWDVILFRQNHTTRPSGIIGITQSAGEPIFWFSVIFRAKFKQSEPAPDVVTAQIQPARTLGV